MKLFSVSHKTELASCHNSCVILMTMLSCKLKRYTILLQFVILLNVLYEKNRTTFSYNSWIIGTRDFDSSQIALA